MTMFRFLKTKVPAYEQAHTPKPLSTPPSLVGKTVTFGDGQKGRVSAHQGNKYCVNLALPDRDGTLIVTDSQFVVDSVKEIDAVVSREAKVRAFDLAIPFDTDSKSVEVKNDNVIVDYQNVVVAGLASTFQSVTPRDRDGDYVVEGAFSKTLEDFRRNPVMLTNHTNKVENIAGSFTKLSQTATGLLVEGKISNAPDMRSVRFKIMEGHLRAFSIGGWFYYGDDGRAIVEVVLWEVSLVAIPANPDALFHARSLQMSDYQKCLSYMQEKVWKGN